MRVLFVTGDRKWDDSWKIAQVFDAVRPDLVIEGKARGADRLAGDLATRAEIELEEYPAEWERYGRAAGPIRNAKMLERLAQLRHEGHEVVCYAFHPDLSKSKGTANMVGLLYEAGFGYEEVK